MTSDLPPSGGSAPEQGSATSGTGSPTPPPSNPTPNPLGAPFFDSLRRIGVYRPDGGRWFAGVAAGLSRRWGVDALLVRGIFVALTIVGGIGLLLYGIAWLFLPQDDGRIHAQQVLSGDVTAGFFGAVVVTLLGFGADGGGGPWGWYGWGFPGGLLLTALIVGGIIYWASRNQRTGRGQPPNQPWQAPDRPAGPGAPTGPGASQPYGQAYPPNLPPYAPPYPTGGTTGDTTGGPTAESRAEGPTTASTTASTTALLPPVTHPYGSPPAYGPAFGQPQFGQPPFGPPPGSNPGGYPAAPQPSRRSASAPSRRITRATFGLALLAGVGGFLAAGAGDYQTGEQVLVGLTAALAVVALGVIVSGLLGRRTAGLAGIGVLLAAVTLIGTAAHDEGISKDQSFVVAGERVWMPTTPTEADDGISQGVGELTVRLTDPALFTDAGGRLDVPVRMGAGRILLVLPESIPARVTIDQGGGQVVDVTGKTEETRGGAGNHQLAYTTGPAGDPVLQVRIRQGAGEIEMQTEPLGGATGSTETPGQTVTPSAIATPTPIATPSPTGADQ